MKRRFPVALVAIFLLFAQALAFPGLYEYRAPFSPRPPALWSGSGERLAYIDNRDRKDVWVLTPANGGWQRQVIRRWMSVEGIDWRPAAAPATAQNRQGVQLLTDLIARQWQVVPKEQPLPGRVQVLAQALRSSETVHFLRLGDTDDDGQPDLLAVPAPVPRQIYNLGPLMIFRAADLAAGKVEPYMLPSAGDFLAVEQVSDVNGDGRTEVVVTYETHGSGGNIPWLFYQWDGRAYTRIFDAMVDYWRGPNQLTIEPGKVTITCRPLGVYDHKFAPHRQHTEVWIWEEGAYRMASHRAPPPPSARQGINDAEAYFRRQDYAEALHLYLQALTLPQEDGGRDWRPYIHLRLGQTLTVLGRPEEAGKELAEAMKAPGQIGKAASIFLKMWRTSGLAAAFAALMPLEPGEADGIDPWGLKGIYLAPPAVGLQTFFQAGGDWLQLQAAGFPVREVVSADLDGDGRPEFWVSMASPPLNEPGAFLAVLTDRGWRVGELADYRSRPEVRPAPGGRGAVLVFTPGPGIVWPRQAIIGWNGQELYWRSEGESQERRRPLLPPAVRWNGRWTEVVVSASSR